MMISQLGGSLTDHAFFRDMRDDALELLAGAALEVRFEPRELVFREGEQASQFYLIKEGRIAIEVFSPQRGPVTIETLNTGELLGWSWLVEPYKWHFDAQAIERTHLIAFDAQRIREAMTSDPPFGYRLMSRFMPVIVSRLQATRMQLLDLYHAES